MAPACMKAASEFNCDCILRAFPSHFLAKNPKFNDSPESRKAAAAKTVYQDIFIPKILNAQDCS